MRWALYLVLAAGLVGLSPPAAAQEGRFTLGGDVYAAGEVVELGDPAIRGAFLTGGTVRQAAPVAGNAHLAGRRVEAGEVGGALYAAGMDLTATGPFGGDASLAGYAVRVSGPVEGNLRILAARADIDAPVAGSVLVQASRVWLRAPVGGDVVLSAGGVRFGPEARIDGHLRLVGAAAAETEIPEEVIPAERVERLPEAGPALRDGPELRVPWLGLLGGWLAGVLAVAAVAALIAAVAPGPLAGMRRSLLARPFGTLGWGFLALSTLFGAGLLLGLTVLGLPLIPAVAVLALLAGFFGYVVGTYSFGAGLLIALGRGEPASLGQRVLAALTGAVLAGVLALIPLLGWLFVLALVLAGIGAITLRLLRPAFFAG